MNLLIFSETLKTHGRARYSLLHEPEPSNGFLMCSVAKSYYLMSDNTAEEAIKHFIEDHGMFLNMSGNFLVAEKDDGFYSLYVAKHTNDVEVASYNSISGRCPMYDLSTGARYDCSKIDIVNAYAKMETNKLIRKVKMHRAIPVIGFAIVIAIVAAEIYFFHINH